MTVVIPTGKQEPIVKPAVGAELTDTVGVPQLSVAVGAFQEATAQPFKVVKEIFAGQALNTGG